MVKFKLSSWALTVPLLFTMCLFVMCCSTVPKIVVIQDKTPVEAVEPTQRDDNLDFLDYIKTRTVSVHRDCSKKEGVAYLAPGNPDTLFDGRGSGTIVSSKKGGTYIITVAHVVSTKKKYAKYLDCTVKIAQSSNISNKHSADIVFLDRQRDTAVLKIEKNLNINTDLELKYVTGEDIWAAGFPGQYITDNVYLSITKGTLATTNIKHGYRGRVHRVTSQVYFGSSGGGVWTSEGKFVGSVSFLITFDGATPVEGQYYIKPVDELLKYLAKKGLIEEIF